MKIKDILNQADNSRKKVCIAQRVKKCSTHIRKAIVRLYTDKIPPKIVLGIQPPDGNGYLEISSYELVNIYGMDNLSALLFLDDLDKANQKKDKSDLRNLLGMLSNGKHKSNMTVTDDLLEYVQQNSPDVWESYQSIEDDENTKNLELANNIDQIEEEDI